MRYPIFGYITAGNTATVFDGGTSSPSTVYASRSGGPPLAGGVVTPDAEGIVVFWLDDTDYPFVSLFDITTGGTTLTDIWSFFATALPAAAAPAVPITITEVANLILNALGLEEIADLTTDTTIKGKTLRRYWDFILKSLLRSHPWKFATKRAPLTLSGIVTPSFGFANAYIMPPDCLRVLAGEFPEDDMKVEGRYILSDEPTLEIRYVYFLEDPSYWDACFTSCFVSRMAAETALPLTEDATKQKSNLELFAYKLREAKLSDGQEGKPREMTFTSLTEVR